MEWLTDNKVPIDDAAEAAFEWLQISGGWFFDGLAAAMEVLIEAVLWLLQTPHPLIIIALFAGLTWLIQRNWKTVAFVVLGFLSLWLLATPAVSDLLVRTLEDQDPPTTVEATPSADAIVLLGGGMGPAAAPREFADPNAAGDRVLHAARLYRVSP